MRDSGQPLLEVVRMRLLPTMVVVALSTAVCAQPYFSPVAAATGLGNVNNTLPFAQNSYTYQQIHDASSFTGGSFPAVIVRMQFRAKGTTNTGGVADLELFMSNSPHPAAHASAVFANNETATSTINVFMRKSYNMPAVNSGGWGGPDFMFDSPFVLLANQNMTWRVVLYSNSATVNTLDCYSDWRNGTSTLYAGCKHPLSTQTPAQSSHNSTFRSPGQPWDLNGYTWVGNLPMPGAVMIGASNALWGAIALPFDMGTIGAPGCMIVNDPAVVIPGVTMALASGFLGFTVPTPPTAALVGQTLYTQFIFAEAGANQLGLFTSRGLVNTPIPAPAGICRIYASGTTATQGTVGPEFAPPIMLN